MLLIWLSVNDEYYPIYFFRLSIVGTLNHASVHGATTLYPLIINCLNIFLFLLFCSFLGSTAREYVGSEDI